jgi:hypothetical protein
MYGFFIVVFAIIAGIGLALLVGIVLALTRADLRPGWFSK